MAITFTKIASVTVGSAGSATISFTSIPATYTDLCIKTPARASSATQTIKLEFNSITTGYEMIGIYADGTSVASQAPAQPYYIGINSSSSLASLFALNDTYISNYASSNYKSLSNEVAIESNATAYIAQMYSGLWSNSNAITSITMTPLTGNFVQYSTATLYGIKNS